jgi:hypothetical protein
MMQTDVAAPCHRASAAEEVSRRVTLNQNSRNYETLG